MALNPIDIAVVSQLLDQALALPETEREAWLAALPAEHQVHLETLRDMLAQEAELDTDSHLAALPRLPLDESVARADDRIGPYRLIREIGRGGMGSVWLAERADGSYKRQLALKLPRLAWGSGLAERMARERDIGALLEHPNIARLYDAGVDDRGRPYLALEFVDGQPIDAWCEARALSVRERLKLFVQVARAVAYAHGRLVVHRDLKPSNVLVTPDGQAHLLDFGIAKLLHEAVPGEVGLTQEQGRVLTPHYASPEQVAGEAITVQSDVYSLGVLLYELLTGTLPIEPRRNSPGAVEDAILEGDAPLANSRVKDRIVARALRGEVDAILAKAMQREPEQRYATADALAQDIERHLSGETVAARPDSVGYRMRKALRRHWVGVSATAAVLVAVLTGSGVAVVQAQRAARSAERERVVKEFVADVFRVNSRIDPKNAALRPASTQSLLEGGAQLIQQRFAGQPDLQAELYGVVGGVFSDMGAYRLATDYATRRVEALSTQRAAQIEQAKGLLALGQALFDDHRYADAEQRARRALTMAGVETTTHLDALVLLARTQVAEARIDAVDATLIRLDENLSDRGGRPLAAHAWSLAVRAAAMSLRNHLDQAVDTYQRAIDIALASEGALSLTAVEIQLHLARAYSLTAHTERAQQHFDSAVRALRQLGGAHEVRATYLSAEFAAYRCLSFSQIKNAEAISALDRSRSELLVSPMPIPEWYIPTIDWLAAQVLTKSGNIAEAEKLSDSAAPAVRVVAPTDQVMRALGITAMHAGQHEVANGLFREFLQDRRQRGLGNHPSVTGFYAVVAQNLRMQGRIHDADAALDEVTSFEPKRGEGLNPNRYNRFILEESATIRLAAGQPGLAVQLLKNAPPAANEHAEDFETYNWALGEALCAAGQTREGLEVLRHQLSQTEQYDYYAHAPWLARLRAVTGLCAVTTGDRTAALRLAARARESFTVQPGVSPYYKAPLLKLERALGIRKTSD